VLEPRDLPMKKLRLELSIAAFLASAIALGQPGGASRGPHPPPAEMIEWPESEAVCREHDLPDVAACSYDYSYRGQSVEAIAWRPPGRGPFPAIIFIPGHLRTARDLAHKAEFFARHGFASLAITLPGYGKTEVRPDYVGPNTIEMLRVGYERFRREPYVDAARMGVFGYSRGAMAASLFVLGVPEIKAAVFGAGVYDFKKAYDETRVPGIRRNMEREAGMTDQAIRERSSILQMEKLGCPVLILHGEQDENAPVSQALALRARLEALKKDFEIHLFPGRPHALPVSDLNRYSLEFFERRLLGRGPARKQP
jgi:dipeptidyl aminopeptidase/acylaminoacyl peptidase